MTLNFGIGLPKGEPLTVETAVRRGHLFVTIPVALIMFGLWATLWSLVPRGPRGALPHTPATLVTLFFIAVVPPALAWLWWSFSVPRWRHWALKAGVDADGLQRLAQAQQLVWPRGSFFERTEFRYDGDDN